MLKNILLTALRNMGRNKSFTIINLAGLSVSMSLALLILTIIHEQLSYDSFHKEADRVFRVNTHLLHSEWGTIDFACAPLPAAEVLKNDLPQVTHAVRVNRQLRGEAVQGETKVPLKGLFTESSFLEVFNFPLLHGSQTAALEAPRSIVLTSSAAEKLFGQADVVGQSIRLGNLGDFQVTGVLSPMEGKTHFEFEALASLSTLPALERQGRQSPVTENWSAYYDNYVYIKLAEGAQPGEMEGALAEISRKHGTGLRSDGKDIGYAFYLQPLDEITPGVELSGSMGAGVPRYMLVFLSVLAAIVLLMSLFNFANLTIAKSLSRAREIGVRKVIGAKRSQVFLQFIGEAVVFSLMALVLSYLLLQLMKVGIFGLSLRQNFLIDLGEDARLYVIFFFFAVVTGILAGLLPATYLSSFLPVNVLKSMQHTKGYSLTILRKGLLVTQFTLSVVFVMLVAIVYRQLDFMVKADYGIEQETNLTVDLQGKSFEKVAQSMRMLPGVVSVGGVSNRLGTWDGGSSHFKATPESNPIAMHEFHVDDNYLRNLALTFVAGGNFNPQEQGGREKEVILNESAVKQLGFPGPVEALGSVIVASDTLSLRVAGVVKDFHFRPLSNAIGPLAFRYDLSKLRYLSVQVPEARQAEVRLAMEGAWKATDPVHPLKSARMSDEIDEAYQETGMQDMLVITGYSTFLVISLACLGMLGMAMYSAQVRAREMGIRKVMGASTGAVMLHLSKSYMTMITIALILGIPVSYLAGSVFLEGYPYRVDISPWLVGSVVLLILSLSVATVWSQTFRVAVTNPVRWLRSE